MINELYCISRYKWNISRHFKYLWIFFRHPVYTETCFKKPVPSSRDSKRKQERLQIFFTAFPKPAMFLRNFLAKVKSLRLKIHLFDLFTRIVKPFIINGNCVIFKHTVLRRIRIIKNVQVDSSSDHLPVSVYGNLSSWYWHQFRRRQLSRSLSLPS